MMGGGNLEAELLVGLTLKEKRQACGVQRCGGCRLTNAWRDSRHKRLLWAGSWPCNAVTSCRISWQAAKASAECRGGCLGISGAACRLIRLRLPRHASCDASGPCSGRAAVLNGGAAVSGRGRAAVPEEHWWGPTLLLLLLLQLLLLLLFLLLLLLLFLLLLLPLPIF